MIWITLLILFKIITLLEGESANKQGRLAQRSRDVSEISTVSSMGVGYGLGEEKTPQVLR